MLVKANFTFSECFAGVLTVYPKGEVISMDDARAQAYIDIDYMHLYTDASTPMAQLSAQTTVGTYDAVNDLTTFDHGLTFCHHAYVLDDEGFINNSLILKWDDTTVTIKGVLPPNYTIVAKGE